MENEPLNKRYWWRYWRRAVRVAWILRFVPYVRMIGLNGSMVTGRIRKESDIDLYLAVEEGHIYLCRVLTTAIVQVLGVRRHGNYIAGRICMNRYATLDHMRITPENTYHARVFHNLVPLFSTGCAYTGFTQDNAWMKIYGYPVRFHEPVIIDTLISRFFRKIGEVILRPLSGWAETYFRRWQKDRYNSDKRVLEPGSRVVLSDGELCFHLAKDHVA